MYPMTVHASIPPGIFKFKIGKKKWKKKIEGLNRYKYIESGWSENESHEIPTSGVRYDIDWAFWTLVMPGHFGFIRCIWDLFKNTIFKSLLLQSELFYNHIHVHTIFDTGKCRINVKVWISILDALFPTFIIKKYLCIFLLFNYGGSNKALKGGV